MSIAVPSARPPGHRLSAALCLTGLLVSSCASDADAMDGASPDSTATASDTGSTAPLDGGDEALEDAAEDPAAAAEHTAEFPGTPAGEAAQYVLELLDAEQDTTAADWEGRLHKDVLAELSAAQLAESVNTEVRPAGPWSAVEFAGTEWLSVTRLESPHGALDMQISVDSEDQLIDGVFFTATDDPEPVETAESFQQIETSLGDLPGEVHALVLDGEEPLLHMSAEDPAPLASTSKLYVLLALMDAIDDDQTSWSETLTVTDQLRSLPSGTLQDQTDGYETTVFDVAQRMIQISDNTGTDMLIDHLGRSAVEDAVITADHHAPHLITPFLTTREVFQLRWGYPERGEKWEEQSLQERRESLEQLAGEPWDLSSQDAGADDVDMAVDWHASPADVASVIGLLAERAEEHPELRSALGSNPGLMTPVDEPWWDELSFKGGSLPGVLTGAWHAESSEGETRTVVILAHSEDAETLREDTEEVFRTAQQALLLDPPD